MTRMTKARNRVPKLVRMIIYVLAAAATALAVVLAYLWLAPLGLKPRSSPAPLRDYEAATDGVQRLVDAEGNTVNPLCHTRLLGHGTKTARAIVIFHGISNCPHQFTAIAETLYAQGYNVLLARLPRQGMADRLSDEPG